MATNFLSTANPFNLASSSSSSMSLATPTTHVVYNPIKCNVKKRQLTLCKAVNDQSSLIVTKRSISISFLTSFVLSLGGSSKSFFDANAAILEADEDDELMERIKEDRKKRIEKQSVINSSNKEKGLILLKPHFSFVLFL